MLFHLCHRSLNMQNMCDYIIYPFFYDFNFSLFVPAKCIKEMYIPDVFSRERNFSSIFCIFFFALSFPAVFRIAVSLVVMFRYCLVSHSHSLSFVHVLHTFIVTYFGLFPFVLFTIFCLFSFSFFDVVSYSAFSFFHLYVISCPYVLLFLFFSFLSASLTFQILFHMICSLSHYFSFILRYSPSVL